MATSQSPRLQFNLDREDARLFCDEARELFELLDTALIELEESPDSALVQQIFRAAHTLKGSSATIGHTKMTALTHAMETVLDAVREGRTAPSHEMVDTLLGSLDALRALTQEVETLVDSGTNISPLEARLGAIVAGTGFGDIAPMAPPATTHPMAEQARLAAHSAIAAGQAVYTVDVAVSPACQLPSIRCFQVLQELDAVASVLECWPSRALIDAGEGEFTFAAVIASVSTGRDLQELLTNISDIASAQVQPMALDGAAGAMERRGIPTADPQLGPDEQDRTAAPETPRKASPSVRIDVERLDGLMNLVGELVIDRTRLEQLTGALHGSHPGELIQGFDEATSHLALITRELQEAIMRSRMQPVRAVFARLPRMMRDIARRCGKRVELSTSGEETELDRSVVEEIADPLVHILRNAIDHGIETPEERCAQGKPETGRIAVTAWSQESSIYLSVTDDGRGIDTGALRRKAVERGLVSTWEAATATDTAALQYVFFPGLSTAAELSDVSGRGVGMDIVRTNIERLNGHVSVTSTPGQGSEFIIQLPLTLATMQALLVKAGGATCALPLASVTEALRESGADLHRVGNQTALRLRGKLLPVSDLGVALGDPNPRPLDGTRAIVALQHSGRQAAFVVDELMGEQDVVVKSLGPFLGNRRGLMGATILGDGSLGLIVDTASLVSGQGQLVAIA